MCSAFQTFRIRIHRVLPSLQANMQSMTALVEQMADHLARSSHCTTSGTQPRLLDIRLQTVLHRCNDVQEVVGVRDVEIAQLLRKCPSLLLLPSTRCSSATKTSHASSILPQHRCDQCSVCHTYYGCNGAQMQLQLAAAQVCQHMRLRDAIACHNILLAKLSGRLLTCECINQAAVP